MNTKAAANCSNCHRFYIFLTNNVNFDKMIKNLCLFELWRYPALTDILNIVVFNELLF